jgi:anti-sigma-K factor RskA
MTRLPDGNGADDELMVEYVLGELSRADADAFERRIAADATLAAEVQRLRNTLDLMPYAAVTEAPPALRGAVLQAAATQAKPKTAPASAPARPARRIVWSRFVAAAAAVLALALGIDSYRLRSELEIQRDVTAMLQEPNVVRSFTLAGAGSAGRAFGSVTLDLDAKKGAVALRRLPTLPAEQVYRLWARVGDHSVPCGDFVAAADGTVRAQFRVPVESYTAPIARLFVTVEPRKPADAPTGPTVMESV